jgi:signal transduction histidine kinase
MNARSGRESSLLALEAARRKQNAALVALERALVAELDSARFLRLLIDSASRLFEAHASVWLVTEEGALAQRITSVPGTYPVGQVTLGEGVIGRCAQERRGLLVPHYPSWPHRLQRYVDADLRHVIAHPFVMGDQLLGVIAMSRAGAAAVPFTEDDFASLEHLAGLAALALRNARLYEEAERRRREAEGLVKVARSLVGIQDVEQVASRIIESVLTLFPGCIGVGVAAEMGEGPARLLAVNGPLRTLFPLGEPVLPGAFFDRVGKEQRPLWITDLETLPVPEEPQLAARRLKWLQAGVQACLGMPLVARGRTIGVLGIGFGRPRPFAEREIAVGQAFADQAALALENARLYQEAERGRREAEVIAEVARTINATLDLDAILQRVTEGARALCQSDIARIAMRDPESGDVVSRYWVNIRSDVDMRIHLRPGTGALGGLVLMTGRPVRTDDWMADPRFSVGAAVVEAEGIVAQMAVPIRIGAEVEGLLYVDNRAPRPFTDRDEAALVQLAEHAAIAIRNARLYVEAQTTGGRLQVLSLRLLEVQEAERRHLARELHDEVGQMLTAVKINLQMLRGIPPTDSSSTRLDDSLEMVDRLLQGVRQMSLDLRPSMLDDLGLAAALRWYVTTQAQRAGLTAEIVTGDLPEDLSTSAATTCYRVVQEAVTNVVRHAGATRLTLTLAGAESGLEVSICDDGCGFDVAPARRQALHGDSMGLFGLEERVQLAGGRSAIESVLGQGTTVRAWLPLATPSRGAGSEPGAAR